MTKLNIPLFSQNKDSTECGVKCSKMILKYFKKDVKLTKKIHCDKEGSNVDDLITFFIEEGFDVELQLFSPYLFNLSHLNLSQKTLYSFFESKIKKDKKEFKWLEKIVNYMKKDGKVKVIIPNQETIRQSLLKNRPLIALGTTRFLYTDLEPKLNFHFVTITGIDSSFIYFNDPYKGKIKTKIEYFLYGLHAIEMDGTKSGVLISIGK